MLSFKEYIEEGVNDAAKQQQHDVVADLKARQAEARRRSREKTRDDLRAQRADSRDQHAFDRSNERAQKSKNKTKIKNAFKKLIGYKPKAGESGFRF